MKTKAQDEAVPSPVIPKRRRHYLDDFCTALGLCPKKRMRMRDLVGKKPMDESKIARRVVSEYILGMEKVFDIDSVEKDMEELRKWIKTPYVKVYSSALGGPENIAILITFSLDRKENWPHNILENSRYCKLYFKNTGVLELIAQGMRLPVKFRKARVKNVDESLKKIHQFIQKNIDKIVGGS